MSTVWTWDRLNNEPCEWDVPELARIDGKPFAPRLSALLANAYITYEVGEADDSPSGRIERIEEDGDLVHLEISYPKWANCPAWVSHLWFGPGAEEAARNHVDEQNQSDYECALTKLGF